MKFQKKVDDDESREYWDTVRRGAREYDELPAWKKGVLGGVEHSKSKESVNEHNADGSECERE